MALHCSHLASHRKCASLPPTPNPGLRRRCLHLPSVGLGPRKALAAPRIAASGVPLEPDCRGTLERCFSLSPEVGPPSCSSSAATSGVVMPVMKARKYGAFGSVTLEKSKLDLSQKTTRPSPECMGRVRILFSSMERKRTIQIFSSRMPPRDGSIHMNWCQNGTLGIGYGLKYYEKVFPSAAKFWDVCVLHTRESTPIGAGAACDSFLQFGGRHNHDTWLKCHADSRTISRTLPEYGYLGLSSEGVMPQIACIMVRKDL